MSGRWGHLPSPARPIAEAASGAVATGRARDAEAFATATGRLGGLDQAQVGLLLGTVTRLALEDRHPDGLDGDDVRALLTAAVREATAWQPSVDPHLFLVLVAGALGVHDPEGEPEPPAPAALAAHAALLLTHLLDQALFDAYVDRAAEELRRTQPVD